MKYQRVLFMGTPHFAERILNTLLEENYNVVAVVTQPDKPVGRKKVLTPSEVKVCAMNHSIPVLQPIKIRKEYEEVLSYKPDLIVTCAYGQIVPEVILNQCLCINVHASLLPKLRGGAPMQRAIMNGDKETGITIMQMAKGMDSGDMITKRALEITEEDTLGTLEEKLIALACEQLKDTLKDLEEGRAVFTKQNEEEATFGYVITKEEELLSFENESYDAMYDHIRALIPVPYAYGILEDGLKLKICAVRKSSLTTEGKNGEILGLVEKGVGIALNGRVLIADEVQLEGKNRNTAKEFLNGAGRKYAGTCLK